MTRVTALAGGVGAARMLSGLAAVVGQQAITAVVNTGDDTVFHGLYVSPDLDTVTYTLAGASNPGTGWGLAGETWSVMEALAAFEEVAGRSLTWFRLGDRDLATHLYRTGRLAEGIPLSQVTAEIAKRFGVAARLLPMSDNRVETRVVVEEDRHWTGDGPGRGWGPRLGEEPGRRGPGGPTREVGFQEYFVRMQHSVAVREVHFVGAPTARPAPGVLAALAEADAVVICPSNPVLSIGPLLALPQIASAVKARRPSVVAVSPIIAGKALKGPADRLLLELGHEPSALGVAKMWAPYAGTIIVDNADAGLAGQIEALGLRCIVTPSVMSGPAEAAKLAEAVLGAGAS